MQTEVELSIRVVISEDKRFSLIIKKQANDKIKMIAEELAELLNLSKYALTFFYKGDKVGLNERLGDRDIGGFSSHNTLSISGHASELSGEHFLLCLKGGNEGPRWWKRFTTVDDPCR